MTKHSVAVLCIILVGLDIFLCSRYTRSSAKSN